MEPIIKVSLLLRLEVKDDVVPDSLRDRLGCRRLLPVTSEPPRERLFRRPAVFVRGGAYISILKLFDRITIHPSAAKRACPLALEACARAAAQEPRGEGPAQVGRAHVAEGGAPPCAIPPPNGHAPNPTIPQERKPPGPAAHP